PSARPPRGTRTRAAARSGRLPCASAVAPERLRDGPDEVDDARAPARRDRVVDPDDAMVPYCGDSGPPGPLRERRCGLTAPPRVRQDDQPGVLGEDVLARQ